MHWSRRTVLSALAGTLPAIAEAKKHHHDKKHHGTRHHHAKQPPVDDITDPVVVEPEPTPEPKTKKIKVTGKKHKHHKHDRTASLSALAAPDGVLLKRYDLAAWHAKVRYRPRQFNAGAIIPDISWGDWTLVDAGAYKNWDYLPLANYSNTRTSSAAKFASYTLNRGATVGMIWRGGNPVPNWVAADGWQAAGSIIARNASRGTQTYPVYKKTVGAGEFTIGGPNNSGDTTVRNLPWMLFAESNGTPSTAPAVPSGQSTPQPNQTCPNWLHDSFTTTGPDGATYSTWHPDIDPTYWCYYRHDHGVDIAGVLGVPPTPYGYVATQGGMSENHWGHKDFVFQNADGYWVGGTKHVGTTGIARANTCLQRFHLVRYIVRNSARTETLVDVTFMADYGRSLVSVASPVIEYTPSACPNGNHDTGITTSVPARKIPNNQTDQKGYEPWQEAQTGKEQVGVKGALTINTQQPLDICNAVVCDTPVTMQNNAGVSRIMQPTTGFAFVDPKISADGHFCTDAMGKVVACGSAGAIPQYVKPGLNLPVKGTGSTTQTHFETRAWGDVLVVSSGGSLDYDTEGMVVETHGPN